MSEAAVDSRTVTLAEAKTRILDAFEIQQPVFLWGLPGVGKSELMEQICNEEILGNSLLVDIRCKSVP